MKKQIIFVSIATTFYSQAVLSNNENVQPEQVKSDSSISKYYQQEKEKGWFWYNEPLVDVKTLIAEQKMNIQPSVIKGEENKPKPLSAAWVRINYQRYLDAAMDNPNNKESMMNYLYLEKYIRDKSTQFGYARQSAVFSDPNLDAVTSRPTANFAMTTVNNLADDNKNDLISAIAKEAGIFFFYRSDCQFCHQQAPLIELLAKEHGFTITAVALDGKPLNGTIWENNFLTNNGQAEKLNVLRVPALYLATNTNKVSVIVQGVEAYPMIKTRLVDAAKRTGLITEKTQDLTRPSNLYKDVNGVLAGKIESNHKINANAQE